MVLCCDFERPDIATIDFVDEQGQVRGVVVRKDRSVELVDGDPIDEPVAVQG